MEKVSSLLLANPATFVGYVPEVHRTPGGVPYLQEPGVMVLAQTVANVSCAAREYLAGFDEELGFGDYHRDPEQGGQSAQLSKFAGQICYQSFSKGRTWNKDIGGYIDDIKKQGHGSVLEHGNVTLLLWGISRSLTHELVRHRAGYGFSQVSQRYVSGKTLRFVERPEFVASEVLHGMFMARIDHTATDYEDMATVLIAGRRPIEGESKTDARKAVNQVARCLLPNETEAPIVVTGNHRAWRHLLNMRASKWAEPEIRRAAYRAYLCLVELEPEIYSDFTHVILPDGTDSLTTPYPKV